MNFETFYNRIAILIQQSTNNQKTICKEAGIPESTLSRLVNKQSAPDIGNLIKLATYFNVSTDWLLGLDHISTEYSDEANRVAALYDKIDESDKIIIQAVLAKYKS